MGRQVLNMNMYDKIIQAFNPHEHVAVEEIQKRLHIIDYSKQAGNFNRAFQDLLVSGRITIIEVKPNKFRLNQ